jgi:hypothetical protein
MHPQASIELTMAEALILTLDLATNTGFCLGRWGQKPLLGKWVLKNPEDEQARATRNLGCKLRDLFTLELPDLVVVEAAMDPAAMLHKGNGTKSVTLLWMLQGAVGAVLGCYGLRMKPANVMSVRKAVLGNGRPADPKAAAIAFCKSIGLNPKDDNEADAALMWMDECGYRAPMGKAGVPWL